MKTKILVISPFAKDANSLYRCMGPMSYLANHSNGEIEISYVEPTQDTAWHILCQYNIIFFHRPCRNDDLTFLRIAKYLNIPVWIDYDDWLFDLPTWNPHKGSYDNTGLQTIMSHMLACADLVTCTTSALYSKFSQVNTNVVILPNAYRSDLFSYRNEDAPPRQPIIAWRGSRTHDGDLLSVTGAWDKLPGKIHFLGMPPWNILGQMNPEKYQTLTEQDVFMYFKYVYNLAPKVMVFPLVDCFFNHAKSNIAYQEALHAGALCVAPDMPEWRHPGIINYQPHNPSSFLNAVNESFNLDSSVHSEQVKQGFESMKDRYDITVVNQIRKGIVDALVNCCFERNTRDPWDQLTAMQVLATLKKVNEQKSA